MPDMRLSGELAEAIEGLYETFSAYPLPAFTDTCLHCHTLDDEAKLHSLPLRELDLDELRHYAADALLVWGDENVFKHFLPRIFELYFTTQEPSLNFICPEMLLSRLRYGHWRTWPPEEQRAVDRFLHAVWVNVLQDRLEIDDSTDIEGWLCSIGQAEDDLKPYLEQWIADDSQDASLALSSLLLSSAVALNGKRGRNAFWNERDEQYEQLQRWAKGPAVKEKLANACTESVDADVYLELAAAADILG